MCLLGVKYLLLWFLRWASKEVEDGASVWDHSTSILLSRTALTFGSARETVTPDLTLMEVSDPPLIHPHPDTHPHPSPPTQTIHDGVVKWKHFPRYWPFVRGIHRSTQRPVARSFDVFFDLRLNKRLSKQSWSWWFETLSHPLWRHCNENTSELAGVLTSKRMSWLVLLRRGPPVTDSLLTKGQ